MPLFKEIHFAADHPTAAGHFPANPIIPGALLLDEVVQAIAGEAGNAEVTIRAAKFFRPVRPGESLRVQWQPVASGAFKFECHLTADDALVAAGTLETGLAG